MSIQRGAEVPLPVAPLVCSLEFRLALLH
jgi:hypothetical protein